MLEVIKAFLGRIGIFADNETDIISADGRHDLGDFQSIQDGAKGLGQAWQGFEDDLVLDRFEHDQGIFHIEAQALFPARRGDTVDDIVAGT